MSMTVLLPVWAGSQTIPARASITPVTIQQGHQIEGSAWVSSADTKLGRQSDSTNQQCDIHGGWIDSDGDRIPDIIESAADFDGDGIANYLDTDSDNDSIPDASEAFNVERLANQDLNADGIDDTYDVDPALLGFPWHDPENDGVANDRLPIDSDDDGQPDYLDTDSDNDGLLDADEINTVTSTIEADTDKDGLSDFEEHTLGTAAHKWDSDGGGVGDGLELQLGTDPLQKDDDHIHEGRPDADNDGIANHLEGHGDADLDRVPNYLDLDSDNDGWFDTVEAGLIDADNNGTTDDSGSVALALPDHDHDDVPDFLDLDSDNDGISDSLELPSSALTTRFNLNRFDIDNDGLNNNVDLDADGDMQLDINEAGFFHSNGSGIVDVMTDIDIDGIPDSVDMDFFPTATDSDLDGIADQFDTQHSVETITTMNWTTMEEEIVVLPNNDLDHDSIVDRHDPDHDGDGQADEFGYLAISQQDADSDTLIDLFDSNNTLAATPVSDTDAATNTEPQLTDTEARPPVLRPVPPYISCATTNEPDTTTEEPPSLAAAIPDTQTETQSASNSAIAAAIDAQIGAASANASLTDQQLSSSQSSNQTGSGSVSLIEMLAFMLIFLSALRCRAAGTLQNKTAFY